MRLRSAALALAMLCTTPVRAVMSRSARLALAATTLVSIPILVANIFLARLSELAVAVTAEVVEAARPLEAARLAFCTLAIFSYTALVALVRSFAMAMRLRLLRARAAALKAKSRAIWARTDAMSALRL